jgi:hypothetical protein
MEKSPSFLNMKWSCGHNFRFVQSMRLLMHFIWMKPPFWTSGEVNGKKSRYQPLSWLRKASKFCSVSDLVCMNSSQTVLELTKSFSYNPSGHLEQNRLWPIYNVDDPKLDSATYKSIAATNLTLANSSLDNPSVLCAFCDEPLPGEPSNELVDLREALEDETWPDPQPWNAGHHDAESLQVTFEYC